MRCSLFLLFLPAVVIFFINFEFFLIRDFLNKLTEEEGKYIESIHMRGAWGRPGGGPPHRLGPPPSPPWGPGWWRGRGWGG